MCNIAVTYPDCANRGKMATGEVADEGEEADASLDAPAPDRESDAAKREHPRFVRSVVRSRRVRAIALVLALLTAPIAWSYVGALRGPGMDSDAARSVEWMRDHHLGWVVDRAEQFWTSHHQPKVGGRPSEAVAIPAIASTIAAPAGVEEPTTTTPTTAPVTTATTVTSAPVATVPVTAVPLDLPLERPAPIVSPATPTIPGEGQWSPVGPTVEGYAGAYATLVRADAVHTSLLGAVVWIDPHVLQFRLFPGTKTPGGPFDRPNQVPDELQASLVGAFEGGFRQADSHGGIAFAGRECYPLREAAATLAIDHHGMPTIGLWGRDFRALSNYDGVRQNLDLVVDNGEPVPTLDTDQNKAWGFTGPKNNTFVYRSGIGQTKDGALVWVGGPGFSVKTLAQTLVRAGAVRGMQLDINQEWVQFNTYAMGPAGKVIGRKLMSDMSHTGDRFLTVDTRDFVAIMTRHS